MKRWTVWVAVAITAIAFLPALNAGFVNWDDPDYVYENEHTQNLTFENFLTYFHPDNRVQDTYTPLTLISFGIEYNLVGNQPFLYHLNNVLLHLVNVALVYWLMVLLLVNWRVAFFVALIFGIHPMHVESVAWITERKDVLFAFFFLLSCISYCYYLQSDKEAFRSPFFWLSFAGFILSALSKAQAVPLPFLLLLFDWWKQRQGGWKLVLEKLPFLLMGGMVVWISLVVKASDVVQYDFIDRVVMSSYANAVYLVKFFVPVHLCNVHPMPGKIEGMLPLLMYLSLSVSLLILVGLVWSFKMRPYLFFGMLFFLLCIGPTLHLVKISTSIIYERYTYLPYIGLLMIVGVYLEKKLAGKWFLITVASIALIFSVATFNRASVWQNDETLWTDAIRKYLNDYFGYKLRGHYWLENGKQQLALLDYNESLQLHPDQSALLVNRGMIYKLNGDWDKAVMDFSKAIELDANDPKPYLNLGLIYLSSGDYEKAQAYLSNSIEVQPSSPAYHARGVLFKRQERYEEALADLHQAALLDPANMEAYYSKGLVWLTLNEPQEAIKDFNMAARLRPDLGKIYWSRSRAYEQMKDYQTAQMDAIKARDLGYEVDEAYMRYLLKNNLK